MFGSDTQTIIESYSKIFLPDSYEKTSQNQIKSRHIILSMDQNPRKHQWTLYNLIKQKIQLLKERMNILHKSGQLQNTNGFAETTINNCVYSQYAEFQDSYTTINYQRNSRIQFFDVKLMECIWENQVAVIVCLNDISDRTQLDHSNSVIQQQSRVINFMSHNLKTPLNGILLLLDSSKVLSQVSQIKFY